MQNLGSLLPVEVARRALLRVARGPVLGLALFAAVAPLPAIARGQRRVGIGGLRSPNEAGSARAPRGSGKQWRFSFAAARAFLRPSLGRRRLGVPWPCSLASLRPGVRLLLLEPQFQPFSEPVSGSARVRFLTRFRRGVGFLVPGALSLGVRYKPFGGPVKPVLPEPGPRATRT